MMEHPIDPSTEPAAEPSALATMTSADDCPGASAAPPADGIASDEAAPIDRAPVSIPPVVDIHDLDWSAVQARVAPRELRARMRGTVEAMELFLDRSDGPALLFDADRSSPDDRAIQVRSLDREAPLWIIGDLHGDLLALEAALALIESASSPGEEHPNIVFLGDLFDDEGFGLELLLRVFELMLASPDHVCVIVGNHDEALHYGGNNFASAVSPGDFADFLNANLAHEWIERAGKLAVRFFAQAPCALFMPDGLLIAHAGFPLSDLHEKLRETGNWNDPACLSDFVWARAHPTARRKMPNRFTRGSQFGYEDFAAFCKLSAEIGRPVTHMVRGHDHVDDRFAIYPAYRDYPVLTTVALSRRLPRESFGPRERVPTVARYIEGSLPQVYRLHVPAAIVDACFPEPPAAHEPVAASDEAGQT